MSDAVITAIIVAVSSIVCQVLINRSNRVKRSVEEAEKEKKRAVDDAVKDEHLNNRLDGIETQLKIHNSYAEKFGEIQTDIAVIKNDIKTLYKAKE